MSLVMACRAVGMTTLPENSKYQRLARIASLLLVVTVICGVIALLTHRQRQRVITRLTDQIICGSDSVSAAAVRRLVNMPYPPIPPLAAATVSLRRPVALEAQQAISDLLRRWQREINSAGVSRSMAARVTDMTTALAQQRDYFSHRDQRWVDRTVRKLLRMSGQLSAEASPNVAAQCELILASVRSAEQPAPSRPGHEAIAALGSVPSTSPLTLPHVESHPQVEAVAVVPTGPQDETPVLQEAVAASDTSMPQQQFFPAELPLELAAAPQPQGDSSYELPSLPAAALDLDGTWALNPAGDFQTSDARALLRRWLAADEATAPLIEKELSHRGIRQLSGRLVERCLSQQAEERLSLLKEVQTSPGVDPRPWLLLLAEDPEAEVRLAAVAGMVESSDRRLIAKAWQVAATDPDPRVAALAERLSAVPEETALR